MQWIFIILIIPYLVIILIIYKGLNKLKPFVATTSPAVKISVVLACRDEHDFLPHILEDINNQDYPTYLLEIIIVDDNSTDDTFAIASSFLSRFRVIVLKNTGIGKKQALRTGIAVSSGELIITTDADCRAGNSWIATISSFYERNRPDLIICPVSTVKATGFFGGFPELEFLSLQGITAGTAALNKAVMCNGANLSFTREIYDKHSQNLHDEIGSGDDIFLLHSIKKDYNTKIEWLESAEASVVTAIPGSLGIFLNQRKRWISKFTTYNDHFTIMVGFVTFVTIFTQITRYALSLTDGSFIGITLLVFLLKLIPDYLILSNTTSRYNKSTLMRWFIPAQFVYPFYVISVVVYSFFGVKKNRVSSPSPKGI
jgi:cellulose synthase/poly-beta-1,6-N-acetylglucosamine synthase-like glycosyltransferase